jgi:UDP-N-acetylmuramyl pentapeptide phosphotransferase/UDP-N-acetylglucosamine-1-phosphate transferase
MNWAWLGIAGLLTFLASAFGTRIVLGYLERRAILDRPNARSSHSVPTPRGGGLALIGVLLAAWALIGHFGPEVTARSFWPLLSGLVLAAVSWQDDLKSLPALLRFVVHIGAVALGMLAFEGNPPLCQGLLPFWLDRAVTGFLWLWFLNLFNFMDGIDGITGAETATLGIGVALVAALAGLGTAFPLYGITAAGAALGFLWWNWHPARIFLGDVGSVPLGYLLGWLLLSLASRGLWAPALLLPLYYLADSTITLLRRLLRGERFWEGHQKHFYQQAARRGLGHARIVLAILTANAALLALAAVATRAGRLLSLALGTAVVAILLGYFGTRAPARRPTP